MGGEVSPIRLRLHAGLENVRVRMDVRLLDRDKKKVGKLGQIDIPLDIRDFPVLPDPPPPPEEQKASEAIRSAASKTAAPPPRRPNKSKSEKEYQVVHKSKPAGDLTLDCRLRPGEAMLVSGTMVVEFFEVAMSLIKSPLIDRWTAEVFEKNVSKVASVLSSVRGALVDWRFANMLSRFPGGGVSLARLEEAELGLEALRRGLATRLLKESQEREEEEERAMRNREREEQSRENRRRLQLERARRCPVRSSGGEGVWNLIVPGTAHADFVEHRVHGKQARLAGVEMEPSRLKTWLLNPACPDRITMMRWSLTDLSADLMCTYLSFHSAPHVVELDLPENMLSPEGARRLAQCMEPGGCLCKLEMLCLRQNEIADAGAKALANAVLSSTLMRGMDISSNRVQKDGAMYLSQMISRNKSLTYLNVSGNLLGPEGEGLVLRGQASRRTQASKLQLIALGQKHNTDTLKLVL